MAQARTTATKAQSGLKRLSFLGKSQMAALIAGFDWSNTSLGPIGSWKPHVQTAVSMMLQSPTPIILLWGPKGYTIYNDAYSEFAAEQHPGLLGQPIITAWPEVADFNRNVLKRGLAGKTLSYRDQTFVLHRTSQPEEVSMDLHYSPILGENGKPAGVMAIVIETTGRVKAMRRIEQQNLVLEKMMSGVPLNEKLEFLVQTTEQQTPDSMRATVLLLSEDRKHLVVGAAPSMPSAFNHAIGDFEIGPKAGSCGTAAYTKKTIIVSDTAKDPLWENFRDLADKNDIGACWSIPIFSSEREVLGTVAVYYPEPRVPGKGDLQQLEFIAGTAAIMIERDKVQTELQENEQRFRFVVQNATDIITVFDKRGVVKYQSPSIERVLGRKPRAADAKSNIFDSKLVHPEDRESKNEFLKKIITAEPDVPVKGEFRMHHADGTWREVEAIGVNLLHLPQLKGVILSSRDVTERKRSEAAYRESELLKTAYFETALDAIITMDEQGLVKEFNPAATRMFGYTRDEAIGSKLATLIAPTVHGNGQRKPSSLFTSWHFSRILNKRQVLNARRKSSAVFPCELTVTSIDTGREQLFTISIQDITERKLAEESLEESERRFRTLADNIQNLAWIAGPDGSVYWYNSRWYEYTGTAHEQMRGNGWQSVLEPLEATKAVREWKRFIKAGKPFELLLNIRAVDGNYRHFLTRVTPVRDENGTIQQWLGTSTDVEDLRQRHELEQRMERLTARHDALIKLNKTKDEFTALASHQLRTPASAVKQYIGVLLGNYVEPALTADQRRYLQTAYDSNERELDIINELLKTAQIDADGYQIDMYAQDILPIVHSCIAALQPTLEARGQTLTLSVPADPVVAKVDPTEIGLVFTNLLENASKYSSLGSTISVSVKPSKHAAAITVADTGVGINEADQQRIFDKFTRIDNKLSDTVSGTGLGLYWVQQIVTLHKGHITLVSTPGVGSEFTVRLPL